jgi:hypothetical protein
MAWPETEEAWTFYRGKFLPTQHNTSLISDLINKGTIAGTCDSRPSQDLLVENYLCYGDTSNVALSFSLPKYISNKETQCLVLTNTSFVNRQGYTRLYQSLKLFTLLRRDGQWIISKEEVIWIT